MECLSESFESVTEYLGPGVLLGPGGFHEFTNVINIEVLPEVLSEDYVDLQTQLEDNLNKKIKILSKEINIKKNDALDDKNIDIENFNKIFSEQKTSDISSNNDTETIIPIHYENTSVALPKKLVGEYIDKFLEYVENRIVLSLKKETEKESEKGVKKDTLREIVEGIVQEKVLQICKVSVKEIIEFVPENSLHHLLTIIENTLEPKEPFCILANDQGCSIDKTYLQPHTQQYYQRE